MGESMATLCPVAWARISMDFRQRLGSGRGVGSLERDDAPPDVGGRLARPAVWTGALDATVAERGTAAPSEVKP